MNRLPQQTKLPLDEWEAELLKLDNQLCFQLYAASKAMTRAYRPFLEEVGLTYPQYLVMMVLWEEAYCSANQPVDFSHLSSRLSLDSGTLTPLIKRLQKLELVTKQRASNDERNVQILLTETGLQLSKQAACVPIQLLDKVKIPIADLLELRDKLKVFLEMLA